MNLGLVRHQTGQDTAEPQRLLAQLGTHPVLAARCRVALVEDEVDDLEHRSQTGGELGAARHLDGDARLGQGPLGADDPLSDGRFRDEECMGDLVGRQSAEQAQRQRHAGLGRENRMAGREHEAEEVVPDLVVECCIEVGLRCRLLRLDLTSERLVLAREQGASAQAVDRAMLRGGHEPGARVVRDACLRPLLERRDERILRELLGKPDVAHHPREPGDEPRRLDPPDRLDGAVDVTHACSASPIGHGAAPCLLLLGDLLAKPLVPAP